MKLLILRFSLFSYYYGREYIHLYRLQVAQFNVYYTAMNSVFPCLMAFYFGAWSDIFGRKVILYACVVAGLLTSVGMLLNAYFFDWPLLFLIPSTIFFSLVGKCMLTQYNNRAWNYYNEFYSCFYCGSSIYNLNIILSNDAQMILK